LVKKMVVVMAEWRVDCWVGNSAELWAGKRAAWTAGRSVDQ
jgi:hypothetical protein